MSAQTIFQARLDPSKSGYRSPPGNWQAAIAKLARQRAAELLKLAEELGHGEGEGGTAPSQMKPRDLRLMRLKDLYRQAPQSVRKAFVEFLADEPKAG